MDNHKNTQSELIIIHKLISQYEDQLKAFGVELTDLPSECKFLLDQYADIKDETKIHDLDDINLNELYCILKKDHIDNYLLKCELKKEILALESQISGEEYTTRILQEFANSVEERISSDVSAEINEAENQKQVEDYQERLKFFLVRDDINLDEILEKIDILRKRSKK